MYYDRDLPDNLDDCHKRIVTLEDAVQREVETVWNVRDRLHDKYEEEFTAKSRSKAMVRRLLMQLPREWIRKFIYFDDPHYTTIRRDVLRDNSGEGEY